MARPVKRSPDGPWSLMQVYKEAGVSPAVARTCAAKGYVRPADLREEDIVRLRVAAALLGSRMSSGIVKGVGMTRRDREALALLEWVLAQPFVPEATTLVVRPEAVRLADSPLDLVREVLVEDREPRLLLPIGRWIEGLPTRKAASKLLWDTAARLALKSSASGRVGQSRSHVGGK